MIFKGAFFIKNTLDSVKNILEYFRFRTQNSCLFGRMFGYISCCPTPLVVTVFLNFFRTTDVAHHFETDCYFLASCLISLTVWHHCINKLQFCCYQDMKIFQNILLWMIRYCHFWTLPWYFSFWPWSSLFWYEALTFSPIWICMCSLIFQFDPNRTDT